VLLSFFVAACGGDDGTTPIGDDDDDIIGDDDDSDSDLDSDSDTDTDTDTTDLPVYDCDLIPDWILNTQQLNQPKGYHDLAFDAAGFIIGSDSQNNALVKVDGTNTVSILAGNIGMIQQMEWLPNGDLAVASDQQGAILRIAPGGGVSLLASDVRAYGLVLGVDDYLYAANDDITRIDHTTGQKQVIFNHPGGWRARVINWNLDKTKLYVGTLFGNGNIYALDVDPITLEPISGANVFASGVGSGSYHDTLGVDVCGYLYVSDYSSSATYRINPTTAQVQTLLDPALNRYGHGMEWGNGVDVWDDFSFFQTQPYGGNDVVMQEIGVPRMDHFIGTVTNLP
jgi:hypothetical protein